MIAIEFAQLANIVNGIWVKPPQQLQQTFVQISTDTRNIPQGALFIALQGERFDAHDYLAAAQTNGAAAAIVSRKIDCELPQLQVADTRLALGLLGQWLAQQLPARRIAMTGSCGKTTLKEMLLAIFAQAGETLATHGNFNNDIGVPLTLFRLEPKHEYAVLELGANHQHEIDYTSKLVMPEVVAITNIAGAHLEGFGSLEGVAQAKSEIFHGLVEGGTAVLDWHTPYLPQWREKLQGKRILSCSAQGDSQADIRAENVRLDANGCAGFDLIGVDEQLPCQLAIPGIHNVDNALRAAGCALAMKIPLATIVQGLQQLVPVSGRLKPVLLADNIRVFDDSYNANEQSVSAAIDLLAATSGKTALIFGDMAELGEYTEECHQNVGEYARTQGLDALFTCGEASQIASKTFGNAAHHSATIELLVPQVQQWLQQHSTETLTLVVKGSRSAGMERVVQLLQSWRDQSGDPTC